METKTYIPLGNSCSIAYNLRLHKLRSCAFPFDWVRIINFNNVTTLLDNNFNNFLDYKNLKFKSFSDKFIVNGEFGSYIYTNKYCSFYHEFDKEIDKCDMKLFIDKYQRRINRLFTFLHSDKELIFIREEIGKLKLNKINKFINCIFKINPTIKFKLIIITNDKTEIKLDNVIFYHSDTKIIDWKRPELNWLEIFNL
jgi:hypothetical protein